MVGVEGSGASSGSDSPRIHSKDGAFAGAVGKKRRRMSSGVPSSMSPTLLSTSSLRSSDSVSIRTSGAATCERGCARGFHVPREMTEPSLSDGGGNARALLRGEGGADS